MCTQVWMCTQVPMCTQVRMCTQMHQRTLQMTHFQLQMCTSPNVHSNVHQIWMCTQMHSCNPSPIHSNVHSAIRMCTQMCTQTNPTSKSECVWNVLQMSWIPKSSVHYDSKMEIMGEFTPRNSYQVLSKWGWMFFSPDHPNWAQGEVVLSICTPSPNVHSNVHSNSECALKFWESQMCDRSHI